MKKDTHTLGLTTLKHIVVVLAPRPPSAGRRISRNIDVMHVDIKGVLLLGPSVMVIGFGACRIYYAVGTHGLFF